MPQPYKCGGGLSPGRTKGWGVEIQRAPSFFPPKVIVPIRLVVGPGQLFPNVYGAVGFIDDVSCVYNDNNLDYTYSL